MKKTKATKKPGQPGRKPKNTARAAAKKSPLKAKPAVKAVSAKSAAAVPTRKPKVAFYWCSSCGGCEEAIVDLDDKILDVVAAVDIVFWPCALDFKTSDVKALPDQGIAVTFINGAIRTSEQEEMVKLLRAKSATVIAFGACASSGGIPALANLKDKDGILRRSYLEAESVINPQGVLPQELTMSGTDRLTIPFFFDSVLKLDDVIAVDYYLPGCPPTRDLIANALNAILTNQLPAKGAVLAPNHSQCKSCERNASKPDRLEIAELKRIHQIAADPKLCFLAQGIVCMGPATRDGCGQLCIKGHMPCTGCFGPLDHFDQGAKMLAALAGIYQAPDETGAQRLTDSLADPAGTFYRYSLSASLLGSKRKE